MSALEIIKELKASTFIDEDGESYTLDFKPGLTEDELTRLSTQFPSGKITRELQEVLRFTRGWEGYAVEAVYFDSIGEFGFTELIPDSVAIGADGLGNYWVLELKENGDAGKIFYACHDPAVLVIYCDTLTEYLNSLKEFFKHPGGNCYFNTFKEQAIFGVPKNAKVTDIADFRQANTDLSVFLSEFDGDYWVVADLRDATREEGFAWGQYGSNQFTRKHPHEYIWVLKKRKKGFLARWLGM